MKSANLKSIIDIYSKYKLSILVSQDGLCCSLFDINENKIASLFSKVFENKEFINKEIQEFVNNEDFNNINIEQVNIVLAQKNITVVPDAIFSEENAEQIYRLNYKLAPDEKVIYTNMPKSGIVAIFSVKKGLIDLFDNLFGKYNLFPQTYSFIESSFTQTKISEKPNRQTMFVQVFENFIEILILSNAKILSYNTFPYQSSNDILYFIINTFEQINLSQNDCEVVFSGFIEPDNLTIINLKKFIKTVYFAAQNSNYKYYYKLQEIAAHYFVNFLNIN